MNGIIVYEKKDADYNQSYIDYMIEEGKKKSMTLTLCLYEKFSYGIREDGFFVQYEGKPLETIDFVIYRCREYLLSRQFEAMGIRVFNNSKVCEICNDKALTYQYVAKTKIPMVPSLFVRNSEIRAILSNYKDKVVMKAVHGHGGSQVCLVDPMDEADIDAKCKLMNGENVVIQPLIQGRRQDLRVYIMGGAIFAAVLRSAKEGFRANFSLGGNVSLYSLSQEEEELIEQITSLLALDYAGIDFIIGEQGELIFNEIEDVVGARMLYQCSELDVVPVYLEYIKNELYRALQLVGE